MPDITMCNGEDPDGKVCPVRKLCYRHTATPTPDYQSYFVTIPLDDKGECRYMWRRETQRTRK